MLGIAPVSIIETCLHKGVGEEQEGWCEYGQGEKGCTRWIAIVQQLALHWLALVILSLAIECVFFCRIM